MFLGKWGEFGDGDGQLNGPSGIDFDSEDNAYLVDQHNHRVQKFTRDGELLLRWGELGRGDSQFNQPWGVAVDSLDNVYVADWRNDRVQKFTGDGELLASFGEGGNGDGQLNRPADVRWTSRATCTWPTGATRGSSCLDPMARSSTSSEGRRLYPHPDERDTRAIANMYPELPDHLSEPYLASSQTEPYFWEPVSVHVDAESRLYVTESRRHRFQVYKRGSSPGDPA